MVKLSSRQKTALLILGIALVCIGGIIGLLPLLLKSQLPALLTQATGRPSTLEKVDLAFWPLSLRVQGFSLKTPDNQPIVSIGELYLEIDGPESLRQRGLIIRQLIFGKPFVHLNQNQDGKLNVTELFVQSEPTQTASSEPFPVLIDHLELHEGKLAYNNARQAQLAATLYPIELALDGFSTHLKQAAQARLTLSLDTGAKLVWTGDVNLTPLHSVGNLKLTEVDLKKNLAYAKLDGLGGIADVDLHYQADYGDKGLNLAIDQAKLGVKDLRLQKPELSINLAKLDHETALTLTQHNGEWQINAKKATVNGQRLQLQNPLSANIETWSVDSPYQISYSSKGLDVLVNNAGIVAKSLQIVQTEAKQSLLDIADIKADAIDLNLANKQLNIGAINIDKASSQAILNADGSLNVQKLLDGDGKPPAADNDDAGTEKMTWRIAAQTVNLNDSALGFTDQTLTAPVTVNFKPIRLTVTGYDSQKPGPLPVTLDMGVNGGGSIKVNGELNLSPPSTKLAIAVKNIDLEKFNGYFSQYVRLSLIDGEASLDGKLELASIQPLALTFQGDAGIADWLTRDQRVFKDFVKWKNLSLNGIALDTAAQRYTAKQLTLDKPYARVTIRKDKTINFDNLLIAQDKPDKPASPKPAKQPTPRYLQLDKLKVKGGSSDFSDLSLILPFSAHIENLQGGAEGMSSEANSNIKLGLAGDAYDLAPVTVNGNLNPYRGDYDIAINFEGLPMPLVSPYMVQFAGYKVEKGKMSLGLFYKVADKKLTANNKLLIDQFELGEKVENPEAVSLPLKLAVALLKDSNGRIKFDVPITGSLENPQFSLRAVIVDAVSNALWKIVSSPFSLLASLSDGEEDLSTIVFNPSHADLTQAEKTKLNKLAAALTERPGLTLGIKGVTYQKQDWPDISDDALSDLLKQRRAEEINKKAEAKIRAEYVTLSGDEYKRLLAEMFIEKFPALAEKSLLGAPSLKNGQAGDFYEIAKDKLTDVINPEPQRLKELAIARAKTIAKYLIKFGRVSKEQIYILDPLVDQDKNDQEIPSVLSLKAD